MDTNERVQYVIDENDYKHYLEKELGRGGQGVVWSTKDPNIIVKIKINPSTGEPMIDEKKYEQYKSELNEVRIVNLPEFIHIARPASLLKKPYCGYVMRLLNDMKPIKHWISSFGEENNLVIFYLKTGGLRHRLELLTNAAEIFTKLYAHSAVYADLSPENLFVSGEISASEVWLIDADNMRYRYDVEKEIMTPHYGAPEVVKGGINTLESDEYSFAILAHEVLTMNSPFEGALITDNEEGGWDDEEDYSELAERGELPWIYDQDDDSNRSMVGIPGHIVFTSTIKELFRRNFSEEGRKNPQSRPKMRDWYTALKQAQDMTIRCPKCKSTYLMTKPDVKCPFCRSERGKVVFSQIVDEYKVDSIVDICNDDIQKFNKSSDYEVTSISKEDLVSSKKIGVKIIDSIDGIYHFYNYHTDDISFSQETVPTIEIEIENGKYTIRNLSQRPIEIRTDNTSYGVIEENHSKKMDEISGIILSMPVFKFDSKEQYLDDDLISIDDLNKFRVRHIKFFVI